MDVLLDLDGTLTDPAVGIVTSVQYALEKMGRPVPTARELHWTIWPPLKDAFSTMFGPEETDLIATGVRFFRERFSEVGLFENEVYPDVPAMLEELRAAGHTLRIATSKPQVFAERLMVHFDLGKYFTSVHGSELDGTRSNKADLIAHLLESQDVQAGKAVMIGDRKHDIIGAKANGVRGIGVLWGYGTAEEFTECGADFCVATPGELAGVVGRLSG